MSLTLVAVLTLCAGATAAPVLDPSHIHEQVLPNGLQVIVKDEPHWGVVAMGLCVRAAPLYEGDKQHGLSDLVRHMMFHASGDGTVSFADTINDLGVRFDTHTTPDATQITAVMATRLMPTLFPRIVRAVFEPQFEEAVWAKQVQDLRRRLMDLQTTATGRLWQLLWENAYRTHPYGRPIAGTPDTMAAFDTTALRRFHETYYVPNNMALIVVGDVRPQTVFDLAASALGGYARKPLSLPTAAAEPPQEDSRTRLEKASVRGTLISYAWRAAGIDRKRDVCTLDLIFALLGEGQTARLTRALMEKEKVEAVPEVEFITKRDPGLFIITCVAKPTAEFETRETVLAEVEKLRSHKITPEELETARALIQVSYAFDNQTYLGQVGSLSFYWAIDRYKFAVDYLSEVERVTPDDIQRVARDYLGPSQFTLVIIRPRAGGGTVWEANLAP